MTIIFGIIWLILTGCKVIVVSTDIYWLIWSIFLLAAVIELNGGQQ